MTKAKPAEVSDDDFAPVAEISICDDVLAVLPLVGCTNVGCSHEGHDNITLDPETGLPPVASEGE